MIVVAGLKILGLGNVIQLPAPGNYVDLLWDADQVHCLCVCFLQGVVDDVQLGQLYFAFTSWWEWR